MESQDKMIGQAFADIPDWITGSKEEILWLGMKNHFDTVPLRGMDLNTFFEDMLLFSRQRLYRWMNMHGEPLMCQYGVPLIVSRLVEMGILEDGKPHLVMPMELHTGRGIILNVKLPYEFLPELIHLRSHPEELDECIRYPIGLRDIYYLREYHYKGHHRLSAGYGLDVEDAHDRHYRFSDYTAQTICKSLHYHPKALGAALTSYYKSYGGPALEKLISGVASASFHY